MRKYKVSVTNFGSLGKHIPVLQLEVTCANYDMEKMVAALSMKYSRQTHCIYVAEVTEKLVSIKVSNMQKLAEFQES